MKRSKTSKYRGVSKLIIGGNLQWRALTWEDGKGNMLGYFPTELEAAKAYDARVIQVRGADAPTNARCFPQDFPRASTDGADDSDDAMKNWIRFQIRRELKTILAELKEAGK